MKAVILAAALLGGCAATHVVDLRRPLVECIQQRMLLGAVKVDADGNVIAKECLAVRVGRPS